MQAPVLRITNAVRKTIKRNFGITAPALQTDPIQQLFIDKLREYKKLQDAGKMRLAPSLEKEMKNDMQRLQKQFGAENADMTKFPTFNFTEPNFDPISVK